MIPRAIRATALLAVVLYGCGRPIPAGKTDYVGEWRGQDMYLLITRDGTVEYERGNKRGAETAITEPIRSVDGERVEHLIAAEADDHAALLAAIRPVGGLDLARRGQGERPAARGRCLHDVERPPVGGEPDPVRPLERKDRLADHRAVGLRVV